MDSKFIGGQTRIIRPIKGRKKVFSESTQYLKKLDQNGQDTGEVEPGGRYSGEKFPQTQQGFRPSYSMTKKQWLIELDAAALDALVKKIKLRYTEGPNAGQIIQSADIYDFDDSFFNHKELMIRFEEGEATLLKGHPMDDFMAASMMADRSFQKGSNTNPATSMQLKYVISDKETDTKAEKEIMLLEKEVWTEFYTMSHERKLAIASAMGLRVADHTSPDVVESQLNKLLKANAIAENGLTNMEWFVQLARSESDVLELKYKLSLAIRLSIIRKTAEGYLLNGELVGKNLKALEEYFSSIEHNNSLTLLMQMLDEKKKSQILNS